MNDREKLIWLIYEAEKAYTKNVPYPEFLADFLLANATFTVKIPKPPTNLKEKCGSCIYAKPTTCFGSSKCYIECTNEEREKRRARSSLSHIKQRTNPACKLYIETKL